MRTLRKFYLNKLYSKRIDQIRSSIGEKWIYIQVDEAQLHNRRFVNAIVGPLDGFEPQSHLLNLVEINQPANNTIICQIVHESLNSLAKQNQL